MGWGYENDLKADVWHYSAFTQGGAVSLAKVVRDKMGCTLLEKPTMREDGIWFFAFTNPFKEPTPTKAKTKKKK